MRATGPATGRPSERWRILAILGVGELLAMSPWLSASAVAPLLVEDWALAGLDVPLLTVAVQLGFVVGALLLAATGAADVIPGRWLFLAGAILAATANLGFAYLATALPSALLFRFADRLRPGRRLPGGPEARDRLVPARARAGHRRVGRCA